MPGPTPHDRLVERFPALDPAGGTYRWLVPASVMVGTFMAVLAGGRGAHLVGAAPTPVPCPFDTRTDDDGGAVARRRRSRQGGGIPAYGGHDPLLDATPVATLDLHGDTASEAERRVRDFVRTHARLSGGRVLHVITGRGRGSAGRPVLPGVVRRVLQGDVARFVEDFDRDLDEAGFLIRLRGPSG